MQLIINDPSDIIISIIIAGIFSCIILDILGYLQKMIGIPEPSWNILGRWGYYIIKNGILQSSGLTQKEPVFDPIHVDREYELFQVMFAFLHVSPDIFEHCCIIVVSGKFLE